MFNKVTVSGALSIIVSLLSTIVPILPPVWGNLVAALLALYAFYHGHQAIVAARAAGVSGI